MCDQKQKVNSWVFKIGGKKSLFHSFVLALKRLSVCICVHTYITHMYMNTSVFNLNEG